MWVFQENYFDYYYYQRFEADPQSFIYFTKEPLQQPFKGDTTRGGALEFLYHFPERGFSP